MSKKWTMPDWMEKYRKTFARDNNSKYSIEDLMNSDFELEFLNFNYAKAVEIQMVRGQVLFLTRLCEQSYLAG